MANRFALWILLPKYYFWPFESASFAEQKCFSSSSSNYAPALFMFSQKTVRNSWWCHHTSRSHALSKYRKTDKTPIESYQNNYFKLNIPRVCMAMLFVFPSSILSLSLSLSPFGFDWSVYFGYTYKHIYILCLWINRNHICQFTRFDVIISDIIIILIEHQISICVTQNGNKHYGKWSNLKKTFFSTHFRRHQHYKRRKSSLSDHHHHHHHRRQNEFSPDGRMSAQPEDVVLMVGHFNQIFPHKNGTKF